MARAGSPASYSVPIVIRQAGKRVLVCLTGDRVGIFNELGQLIISQMTPKGYEEISRAQLIKPTRGQLSERGGVCWSHPVFAYGHVFARNDGELGCASLKAKD